MDIDVLEFWNEKTRHIEGLDDLLARMKKIGMCGSPQPEYLFSLSSSLTGKGAIVEIGTSSGISLIALSLAQKLKNGVRVTSIDIKKHQDLDANLSEAGVEDYVKCILDDANRQALQWRDSVELLWIDGDHTYKGAAKDILAWEKVIMEGGLIALHDYRDGVGVFKAINKHILSRPWIWRVLSDRQYGSIFVAQKISNDAQPWIDRHTPSYRTKARIRRVLGRYIYKPRRSGD